MGTRFCQVCALLLAALSAGCETAYKDGRPNERSPWFHVPVGSKLVLHRTLQIAPGQRSAYLQQGKLLAWYDVNQYAPYCALGVQAFRDVSQSVGPDVFVVGDVAQRSLFTLASRALPFRHVSMERESGDGMTYEVVATVMDLRSTQQPEVRTLVCASWGLPQASSYVTVEKIRRALGGYATLELSLSK
jgi:hypothetical protein